MTTLDSTAQNLRDKLLKKAVEKESKEVKEQDDNGITEKVITTFLDYPCNYKKHKGTRWGDVLVNDYSYFKWVMMCAMNTQTKTWTVLSTFLSAEERETALKNAANRPARPHIKK